MQGGIVADRDQRLAARFGEVGEILDQPVGGRAVEAGRRFVGEDDRRIAGKRPRNRHALPLAAGKRIDGALSVVAKSETGQHGRRAAGDAFALGLACVPVFFISDRLSPSLLFDQMFGSYNSFILLAVPFFLLAANLMNSAGITQRLIDLSRALVGHLPGGLGHINVVVSMLFAVISGSSTAYAACIGSLLIPQMNKQGYDTSFSVAIT
ncbi:MAG: TRAP transporter large permease subunit, partial [Geminicoccaceae bacterium]|nr:TRAP transporter large permease subunit [Geminicoccaceae bacterium]